MHPLLSLISDLYQQLQEAQQEIISLRRILEAQAKEE